MAVKFGAREPAGLVRKVQLLRFDAGLDPVTRRGVPVQGVESLLVHMAVRPAHVRSWREVVEWLGDLVVEAVEDDVLLELEDRPRTVRVRLAYLLQGLWPDVSERIGGEATTKVWFGPGRTLRRRGQRWGFADSVLPFDPAVLPRVRGR